MIKNNNFEGNLTDAAKVANNVESANVSMTKTADPVKTQRSKTSKSQFWAVITKARRTFNNQLHKDNAVKLECVENFIPVVSNDSVKFWADYMDEVNTLLDSRKFENECHALGVDMTNIATHIVFLGAGMRSRVLKFGIRNSIGNDYILYKDKFVPEDAMQFVADYATAAKDETTAA